MQGKQKQPLISLVPTNPKKKFIFPSELFIHNMIHKEVGTGMCLPSGGKFSP